MVVKLEYDANAKGKVASTPCEWKEAVPYASEQKIICVAIGNTHYNWTILLGKKDGFVPAVFWKSPCVSEKDMKGTSPSDLLMDHLPPHVHEEIFGASDTKDKTIGNQLAAALRIPARSVYFLSTNKEYERGLMYAFSDINVRIFRLENRDFFSAVDGCYDTFGVDRAACLFAAFKNDVLPLLVIDGGTAMTYTGLNEKGKIMGGGISPGLGAQFRCLSEYCGNLPLISFAEYGGAGSYPVFATDTRQAMMTSVFHQVSGHCRFIVKQFLNALENQRDNGESAKNSEEPKPVNERKPTVYFTGGDSAFLVQSLHDTKDPLLGDITLKESKHLAIYGIGCLIQAKSTEVATPTSQEELRLRLLGQRVAKKFAAPDIDGDHMYRGLIVSVSPGEDDNLENDLYSIRYDDGDREQMTLVEVYDALQQYVRVGEKENADQTIWTMKRKDDSKQGSEDAMKQLLEGVSTLKDTLEKEAKKEKDKAKAKAAAKAAAIAAVAAATSAVTAFTQVAPAPPDSMGSNSLNSAKRPRIEDLSAESIVESKKTKQGPASNAGVKNYLGLKVAKYFPLPDENGDLQDTIFFGVVESYDADSKFWHIRYEDDDEEDFDETDLKMAIQLHIQVRGSNSDGPM